MSSPRRVYFVGTDTGVGKTALLCELLAHARDRGPRMLPYKPAQSRDGDGPSDGERLVAAAANPAITHERIVCFDFDRPLAPGMADVPTAFEQGTPADDAPIARCLAHLDAAIVASRPELVCIEGAGGLWVPMPGGSWQPRWIGALGSRVVIVARAGLGTINHSLCTIDALRGLGLTPIGFYLCETVAPDPSVATNARVIAAARGVAHLGTLGHAAAGPGLLEPLLARL